MSLNLDEIKKSGLLELYVIGSIEKDDRLLVEQALRDHPSLKLELEEIEKALKAYALLNAVTPPPYLKDKIMESATPNLSKSISKEIPTPNSKFIWAAGIAAFLAILIAYQQWSFNQKEINWFTERQQIVTQCDSSVQTIKSELDQMQLLLLGNNNIIPVSPTEKYPQTKLYLHNNSIDKFNFIQIQNLPPLAANQSFQLWSLKTDQDPIPLDVFESENEIIIPVQFIDDSNAYAITIEQKGGSNTPNLDELIGIFSI